MTTKKHAKVLILGSGPAGYSAAVYAARANLSPMLVTGVEQGGQLMTTTDVENWPGDPLGVQGPELMQRLLQHAERFDTEIVFDHIHTTKLSEKPIRLIGDAGEYTCDALIIATGASPRKLGVPGENEFANRGVSYCAVCDGAFFKGETLAVIGGGDAAVEEAEYLTRYGHKVYVVHRRDEFRASKILQERLFANPKIEVIWNKRVLEFKGTPAGLQSVELQDTVTGELSSLAATGAFIFIGFRPNTGLVKQHAVHDPSGYLVTDERMMTSIPGLFAAGDVRSQLTRQITTAVGDATTAAIAVEKYLSDRKSRVEAKAKVGV
jgi:thioredoxin reductase (NADPH)